MVLDDDDDDDDDDGMGTAKCVEVRVVMLDLF